MTNQNYYTQTSGKEQPFPNEPGNHAGDADDTKERKHPPSGLGKVWKDKTGWSNTWFSF